MAGRRARQCQCQPGIVKLPIPVFDAPLKPLRADGRQALQGALAPEELGGTQPGLASQLAAFAELAARCARYRLGLREASTRDIAWNHDAAP